jgi:hypothetical protein
MTSPGVMWTFLGVPRATTWVDDFCTIWTWGKKFRISEFEIRKGSKCENFRSFESSKSRNSDEGIPQWVLVVGC